jgi:hypothetical protein
MRHVILSVASPASQHFSTSSQNRQYFRKKVTEDKICVFIVYKTFFWNISHSIKNSVRYSHTCRIVFTLGTSYSCQILMKLEFSWQTLEKYSKTNLFKIHHMGVELFDADGQTDRQDKANSRFWRFCGTPKKMEYNRLDYPIIPSEATASNCASDGAALGSIVVLNVYTFKQIFGLGSRCYVWKTANSTIMWKWLFVKDWECKRPRLKWNFWLCAKIGEIRVRVRECCRKKISYAL